MAIYDLGTASLAANGEVTGVGTTWKAPLTLIRVGATIVFKTEPVKIYTISEIISDTQINVYNPNSETVPAGTGYAILAHDGITVQGLAQDVAETLRYYQSRETEVSTAVDIFKDFDQDKFSNDVSQVNTQFGEIVTIASQVSSDASQVSADKDSASSSASSASNSAIVAKSAAESVSGALVGNFDDGVTLQSKNQVIIQFIDGYARQFIWSGSFPKVVPAGSTPETSGGVDLGAWVVVGDDSLRSGLASYNPPGTDLIGTSSGISLTQYLNRIFIFIDNIPGVDKTGVLDSSEALNTAITTYSGVGVEFIGNPSSTYLLTSTVQCIGVSNITLNFNGAKIMDNVQGFIPTSGGRANHTFLVYNSKKIRISNFVYDVAETRADATASNPSAPQTVMIWVGGQYLGGAMTSDVEIDRIYNIENKGLKNGFVVSGLGELDGIRLHDCLIKGGEWKFGCNFEYGLRPEDPATDSKITNGRHPYNIHVERFNVENVSTSDGWWRVASCYNAYFLNCTAYNTRSPIYVYSGDRGITRYSQNVTFENVKTKYSDDVTYTNSSVQVIITDKDGSTADPLPSWSNFDHTFMFINCEIGSTKAMNSSSYRVFGNMGKVHVLGGMVDNSFFGAHCQPAINPAFLSDGAIIFDGVVFKNCFQFLRMGAVKGWRVQNCTFKRHLWGSTSVLQLDPAVFFNGTNGILRGNTWDALATGSRATWYLNCQSSTVRIRDNDFTCPSVNNFPVIWSSVLPVLIGSGNLSNTTYLISTDVNSPAIYGEPCPSKTLELITGSAINFNISSTWTASGTKTIDSITGGKPGDKVIINPTAGAANVTFEFGTVTGGDRIVPRAVATEVKTGTGWSKTFVKMAGAQGWWEV